MSKSKRKERKIRNRELDAIRKKEALDNGKLIRENHNNDYYSKEFTIERSEKLFELIKTLEEIFISKNDFWNNERIYNPEIINLLLYWSPEVEKDSKYEYLLNTINYYWDNIKNDKR